VLVWAGSLGRTGAARLTLAAAQSAGAGLTTLATTDDALPVLAGGLWESMYLSVPQANASAWLVEQAATRHAVVAGPGMATEPAAGQILRGFLARTDRPVVLDADGLNHCVGHLDEIRAAVLTPHPGEAARLLGCSAADVQHDRLGAVRAIATRSKSVTVLKGAHTLVALPHGPVGVCPAGNPGMATAGMGDVLAGIIGALLARGLDAASAAAAGVLWHARAGDRAAAHRGQAALRARDVIDALGRIELEDGPWPT
jgi:NAD(P)H-hydrate epimerase